MNQLKQKIIETEKELYEIDNLMGDLINQGKKNTQRFEEVYNKRNKIKATFSALKLAEEIQNENIKILKINLYNTNPAIIKDEPRCSKIIDEVFE